MTKKSTNPTAGAGDPYWYEWAVGLRYVVQMLNPDSSITSVDFQSVGAKGLDDVVVNHADGSTLALQVKHTRVNDTLSFSDLTVGASGTDASTKDSLLRALAKAWLTLSSSAGSRNAILFTNRTLGTRSSKTRPTDGSSSILRPALSRFWPKLKSEVDTVDSIDKVSFRSDWLPAWDLVRGELSPIDDPMDQLEFLRHFEIQAGELPFSDLEESIRNDLCVILGIQRGREDDAVNALFAALRDWTKAYSRPVNQESAYQSISIIPKKREDAHSLIPPVPFFPSRHKLVDELREATANHPVVLLTGPPGCGKTSIVSQMSNQRGSHVDIRYHAFTPIHPDNETIPLDVDRWVSPQTLWDELLSQLRSLLVGQLARYRVPIRSGYLEVVEARAHVLRICAEWSEDRKQGVLIAIDGIDHAARADAPGLETFLSTLPPPDQVPQGVHFLLAGQEPEDYPAYPFWISDSVVRRFDVSPLEINDIVSLISTHHFKFDIEPEPLARLLNHHAGGSTLPLLFALKEAVLAESLDTLSKALSARQLTASLDLYYNNIWSSVRQRLPPQADLKLAAAISLLRTRITSDNLTDIFGGDVLTWELSLNDLRPLVVEDERGQGYRVMHNDVGVFLSRMLRGRRSALKILAGEIANYLISNERAPATATHASILKTLRVAEEPHRFCAVFTPQFVQRAWLLNRPPDEVAGQVQAALHLASEKRDWVLLHEVCGAAMTFWRTLRAADYYELGWPRNPGLQAQHEISVLDSELYVTPYEQWEEKNIERVLDDILQLTYRGESIRARSVFGRWFDGLMILDIVWWVPEDAMIHHLPNGVCRKLGQCIAAAKLLDSSCLSLDEPIPSELEQHAFALMYGGMLEEAAHRSSLEDWIWITSLGLSFFEADLEAAAFSLIKRRAFSHLLLLVDRFLQVADDEDNIGSIMLVACGLSFRHRIFTDEFSGLTVAGIVSNLVRGGPSQLSFDSLVEIAASIYTIAWLDRSIEPEQTVTTVYRAIGAFKYEIMGSRLAEMRPLMIAVAILGRTGSYIQARGASNANEVVPVGHIEYVLQVLAREEYHDNIFKKTAEVMNAMLVAVMVYADTLEGDHLETAREGLRVLTDTMPWTELSTVAWEEATRRGFEVPGMHKLADKFFSDTRLSSVWQGSRIKLVDRLAVCAKDEGLPELAEEVTARNLRSICSYQESKDEALSDSYKWLQSLIRQGSQGADIEECADTLLSLSKLADVLGEDTLGREIEQLVYELAFSIGPQKVWSLWTSGREPGGHWLDFDDSHIFDSIVSVVQNGTASVSLDTILCLAVGALPIHRVGDRERLADICTLVLRKNQDDGLEKFINERLAFELSLNQKPDDGDGPMDDNQTKSDADGNAKAAERLLERLDSRPWWYDGRQWEYRRLAEAGSLSDEYLWKTIDMLNDLASGNDVADYTLLESVTWNVNECCRLAATGSREALIAGLRRSLKLQRLWLGRREEMVMPKLAEHSDSSDYPSSWHDLVANILCDRLRTRDAIVVASSIRGLGFLFVRKPDTLAGIESISEMLCEHEKTWLAYALEWAASLVPRAVRSHCARLLSHWLKTGGLVLQAQAWLTCRRLLDTDGASFPTWPHYAARDVPYGPGLAVRHGFVAAPSRQEGLSLFSGDHGAAIAALRRISAILGGDVSDVEQQAAVLNSLDDDQRPSNCEGREFRGHSTHLLIRNSRERDHVMSAAKLAISGRKWGVLSALRVAQAVSYGDDPFVIMCSYTEGVDIVWPTDTDIDSGLVDEAMLKNLVAEGLKDDEVVLGAGCKLFGGKSALQFSLCYGERNGIGEEPSVSIVPRLSLLLERESTDAPRQVWDYTSIGAGFHEFQYSSCLVIPTSYFRNKSGWVPHSSDPMKLVFEGNIVARHELIWGPFSTSYSRRQYQNSFISRWVARADAWSEFIANAGAEVRCLTSIITGTISSG